MNSYKLKKNIDNWDFENGFYAKTDGITDKNEPLIYENIYGNALCENVKVIDNKFNE